MGGVLYMAPDIYASFRAFSARGKNHGVPGALPQAIASRALGALLSRFPFLLGIFNGKPGRDLEAIW